MSEIRRPVPIYTSVGEFAAFMIYPYIFNMSGEWIGWVTSEREVYSVHGNYVGWLSDDPRVLRKRVINYTMPRKKPPSPPRRISSPASFPLAPLLPELSFDTIDVLLEQPSLMPTVDAGELRPDMD